jgi:hypothetical protein
MKFYYLRALIAKAGFAAAMRASRNQRRSDRVLRYVVGTILKFDFDLDEMVLQDRGYTPEELEQYQQGK